MAVHSKHPASAPPAAPLREKTSHLALRAWCIFVLFTALAGTAWVHAFGEGVTAAIAIGSGIFSVVLWFIVRPPVNWRRLPWFLAGYVAWATLSLTWSVWIGATAITLLLLWITTTQALFIGSVLTWREIVRTLASALKWVMGLSLIFELWVAVFVQVPVLPGFVPREEPVDPILYWSRANLFDGGRLQGIMGNANLLAPVALLAVIVFAIRLVGGAPRRVLLGGWIALSGYLFIRAGSATGYIAAIGVAIVLGTVLLMRRAKAPGERTKYYIGYAVVGIGGTIALWLLRDRLFTALGRAADLTGREEIWAAVRERIAERPVIGWGYSTPWVTSEPAFDGWVNDHGQSVMQAHNMWLDVLMQLGIIGLVLIVLTYLAFVWRSWFFAVDRPRWDLRSDRPYSPISLLPSLFGALVLVQGVSESAPLLLWGWLLLALFAFKIKQSPHIGEGPAEQRLAIERGELTRQSP
ncbi:O-antigen ligase family protein [Microbacterium terricola]|uniref:O-antigen ligase-related domain-containing protein n=1 Tax=Microbacterium terricola TaxID=344163 RepID=A0ABM8DWS6_9MICO|nr:O-antigen ligase family protein [Microbacterium terricola]UYK39228.1 O-antigen ligase family protein [Microbacterium terricola]BDV30052.1 hypothetical protein Microterr_07120 [Microbacterium terricola]